MKKVFAALSALLFSTMTSLAQLNPLPSNEQLEWYDMEMYAFIHYSLNTYTDQEWGFGNEELQLFNPSDANRQV